jgi:DNA-binding response OmpR family regulator
MNGNVLIIEDEDAIVNVLTSMLIANEYMPVVAKDGNQAMMLLRSFQPDVILLDLGLPDVDGKELMKQFSQMHSCPVLVVSARDNEQEEVELLDLGAHDYITKPFSPAELVARVEALYRRVAATKKEEDSYLQEIVSGDFVLDLRARTLKHKDIPLDLTQVEFQIMEYFFSNPGVALDRIDILNHVWGDAYVGEDKIVDVNIRRLRMKVEDEPSNPKHIITVWGLGYKWDAND